MSTQTETRNGAPLDPAAFAVIYAEVQQFYARHMQLLDAGRAGEWAQTFAADGTFSVPTLPEPVRGREALTAAVQRSAGELAEARVIHRHWHGMLDVEPGADGTLRVRCYALIFATPSGGTPALHRTCVCEDVLIREGGRLVVKHRRVTRDDLEA
jgi:hypothetical protein